MAEAARSYRQFALDSVSDYKVHFARHNGRGHPLDVWLRSRAILDAEHEEVLPACWGNISIRVFHGAAGQRIVQLPHLSRFKLFGRPQSDPRLARAFGRERI